MAFAWQAKPRPLNDEFVYLGCYIIKLQLLIITAFNLN